MRRITLLTALLALMPAGSARGAMTFMVLYNDVDGVGFKDATPVGATTLGALRKSVFEEALSLWGHSLRGSNQVLVKANWVHAGSTGAIAASGVGIQWADFPYAPSPGVAYVPALVSQFYGGYYSYNENFPDILVQFNLDDAWYYGMDGNAPASQYDLYHAALHEICHGLGFQSNLQPDGTFLGQHGETTAPDSYSVNITSNGTALTAMTPAQRKAAAVNGPLRFTGPETLVTTAGQGAALAVTPGNFTIGTTASHLDQSYANTFDNLMVPGQPQGPIYTGEGTVTNSILRDLGWRYVNQPFVTTLPPLVGVPAYNKVTLRALVDPSGQATTARFVVIPDGGLPQTIPAQALPADKESHEISLVAPFDLDINKTYTVQAVADYHHGYAAGEQVFRFVPLTPYAGAMLAFSGGKTMTATGMGIPAGPAPFTVEGWVYLNNLPPRDTTIVQLGGSGNPALSLVVQPSGRLVARMAGASDIGPTNAFSAGQWNQFSVTFNGTALAVYQKGHPEGAATASGHAAMDQLAIGGDNPGGFSFSMDEVRVWNVARGVGEIRNDYDRVGLTGGAGLLASYEMNEATDIVAGTSSTVRNGYLTDGGMWATSTATIGYPVPNATYATQVGRTAATLNGIVDPMGLDTTVGMGWGDFIRDNTAPATPGLISGSSPATPVTARVTGLVPGRRYNFGPIAANAATDAIVPGGVIQAGGYLTTPAGPGGTALRFAGTGDAVRVSNFGQNSFSKGITIQFWQKVDELRQQSTFVLAPDNTQDRINIHTPWIDGNVYFDFGDAGGDGRLFYAPPENITGTWQQFTFVVTPPDPVSGPFGPVGPTGPRGTMAIYRNGRIEAFGTTSGWYAPQAADLSIGGLPAGSFKGALDEVRVWARPLSSAEVQANWRARLNGDEPGLILYMPMDDASGNFVSDVSGHGNDGRFWSNGTNGGQQAWNPYYWDDPAWTVPSAPLTQPGIPDVLRVMRIVGGLQSASAADVQRYSADGMSITLADALYAAVSAAGS